MGKKNYTRWMFVLPAIIIVIALFIYPICSSIVYSFTNKNLIKPVFKFIGFKNYAEVLKDTGFWIAFFNSLKWTVLSLIGQIAVGFTAALALKRIKVCKGVYKTLLIIPWAFPSIVIAFSWKWILNGVYGFLPNVLIKLGICETAPQFLTSGTMAFITLVMINIWFGAPMIMVNVLSALETVPKDQYEAAQIDGAGSIQRFVRITLPNLMPTLFTITVLSLLNSFKVFREAYLIAGGYPDDSIYMLQHLFNNWYGNLDVDKMCAGAVMMAILVFILILLMQKIMDRGERI